VSEVLGGRLRRVKTSQLELIQGKLEEVHGAVGAVDMRALAKAVLDIMNKDTSRAYDPATDSLEAISEVLSAFVQASLTLVRSPSSTTMDGTEQALYQVSNAFPFEFCGGYIDWTGLNVGAGENTVIKAYIKIEEGGSYRKIYEETFLAAVVPDPECTPVPRDINTQCTPGRLCNMYGVKITAQQAVVGAGWNDIQFEAFDAQR